MGNRNGKFGEIHSKAGLITNHKYYEYAYNYYEDFKIDLEVDLIESKIEVV